MSRLWPNGDPIQVTLDVEGAPRQFFWRAGWHEVDFVANRWRVRTTWWSEEAWREYFKLATTDGLLCQVFHNLNDGSWFFSRLYD